MHRLLTKTDSVRQPEERHGIVASLAALSRAISGSRGDAAFEVAAETAASLLRVSCAIVFVSRPNDELAAAGTFGLDSNTRTADGAVEVARRALATGATVVLPDSSSQLPHIEDLQRALGPDTTAIAVPMRVGQTSLGAVVAISETPRLFAASDAELLHVVASQAALAAWRDETRPERAESPQAANKDLIELAQRQIQELSLINQVSEAVSSTLDLEPLLDIALEQSLMAVEADAGSLMLVNEETDRLEIVASRGLARRWVESTSQDKGASIAGWVVSHGESVVVSDAQRDPRFRMRRFRNSITSAASIPLKTKSSTIGVLNVNTTRKGRSFDERDLEVLGTIANQMAVAIDNARLYARVARRTKQLDSLLQISKTVTSTLNLDEVLRRLSYQVCKLFSMDACALLLFDELSGRLRLGYGTGLKTRRRYAYYDLAAPLASHVRKTGRRLTLRDLAGSSVFSTAVAKAEGIRTAMCLPLKNHGRLVGIAAAFSRTERPLPRSQKDIMGLMGELAGVAISNARVYRQKYRIAEIMQQKLVPSSIPELDGLEIGHKFLPAREVGGDYYDFICSSPDRISVVMADVAGSDVEAAEYTSMGRHVLRAYARGSNSPSQVLTQTNSLICEDTRAGMFISLFYGTLDLSDRTLSYCNAGCEPALLYRAADRSVQLLTGEGILLGITPTAAYQECSVSLQPGDVLALYTDGLTEAGVGKARFGRQSAMDTLAAAGHLSAQQIADHIHDALLEFVNGRITDDVAMVVLKVAESDLR